MNTASTPPTDSTALSCRELQIVEEIEQWRKSVRTGGGVSTLSRTVNTLCSPLDRLVNAAIPDVVFERSGSVFEGVLRTLQYSSVLLMGEEGVVTKARQAGLPVDSMEDFEDIPIAYLDALAQSLTGFTTIGTAVQGGVLGFAGQALGMLDVPSLLLANLKLIVQVGVCYGFQPDTCGERDFALRILAYASSSGTERAREFERLEDLTDRLIAGTFSETSSLMATKKGLSGFAEGLIKRLLRRRLSRHFPVVGVLFGFGSNYRFTHDVSECAYMLCRERHLRRRIPQCPKENPQLA